MTRIPLKDGITSPTALWVPIRIIHSDTSTIPMGMPLALGVITHRELAAITLRLLDGGSGRQM